MEKIGLLVDSTTLTRDDIKKIPFLKVAPLGVTIDGKDYSEFEITSEDTIEHLKTSRKLTTSQPSPGNFLDLYKEFFDEGYTSVLVLTLSEKISGTFQAALIAKSMIDFPLDISVHAPNMASFGVAIGIPVLAKRIEEGIAFDDLITEYQKLYAHGTILFTLSNLMHLFRGGRLSRISALLGTVLRIKPVVEMIDGKLQLTRKERTNVACYDYFLEVIDNYANQYQTIYLDIIEMNRLDWAEKLEVEVKSRYPRISIHITHGVTPVFHVHLGDTGFGIAILAE